MAQPTLPSFARGRRITTTTTIAMRVNTTVIPVPSENARRCSLTYVFGATPLTWTGGRP
jgi:hypothetical protein